MVPVLTDPTTVELELPQSTCVWNDLEYRLLEAEVNRIFADAPTPGHRRSVPTVATRVHSQNTRPPLHSVLRTPTRSPNTEVSATQRSPPIW
ncbi:hypothetical protein SAMN04490220_6339 [Rhodococcus jostii]|uniref:Uncharacterized protein n=1 Tax=Rhodococcus jostii TaxID=132919 RepID=A0A1H5FCE4_RHOJO|nr:hypothetical protein SAMN04490220_6339 [Rhodococcus jostii]